MPKRTAKVLFRSGSPDPRDQNHLKAGFVRPLFILAAVLYVLFWQSRWFCVFQLTVDLNPMTSCKNAPNISAHGLHLLIDLYNGSHLDDEAHIKAAFHAIVEACGATMIRCHTHRFAPHGVTGVALLAESHISAHTWPEQGFAAFDVFMCGETNPRAAIEVIQTYFESTDIVVRDCARGRQIHKTNS